MPRPQDMGPADLAPNTAPPEAEDPEQARRVQRNAFYNSLPIEAKDRFLRALELAEQEGLGEEEAWRAAARAAQTSYAGEG